MRKLFVLGTAVCMIALCSCNDDKTAEVVKNVEDVVEKEIITAAFTIRVQTAFNGLSDADQTYGKFGVFYCEKGAQTDDLFTKWLGGDNSVVYSDNKQVSSSKLTRKRVVNLDGKGSFNILLEGLTPNKEYSVCAYFENEFGENRKIGKIQTVKTKEFSPVLNNLGIRDSNFFSANTKSELLNLDSVDGKYCSFGVQYSLSDQNLEQGNKVIPEGDVLPGTFEVKLTSLNASTEYQFRPFLSVKDKDTIFGSVKNFGTRDYDDATVDMGTSVLWSKYFLGAESDDQCGDLYRFGQVEPVKMGGQYALVDKSGYFTDACPENISGTEFDAAKKRLGGKWRIPTRAEIQELLNAVNISAIGASDRYKSKLKLQRADGQEGTIILPQTDYCYAYSRKVKRYTESGYIYFTAADMDVSEPSTYYSYNYNLDDDQLDELVDAYIEEHPNATVIYLADILEPLIDQGLVTIDTITRQYRYMTLYEPNNYMYYITVGGGYEQALNDNKWDFRSATLSYGDYGFCILPVRDRDDE